MMKMRKMLSPWEDAEFTDVTKRRHLYVCTCRRRRLSLSYCSFDKIRANFNSFAHRLPRIIRSEDPAVAKSLFVPRSLDYDQTNSNKTKYNSGLSFMEQRLKGKNFLSGCDGADPVNQLMTMTWKRLARQSASALCDLH